MTSYILGHLYNYLSITTFNMLKSSNIATCRFNEYQLGSTSMLSNGAIINYQHLHYS